MKLCIRPLCLSVAVVGCTYSSGANHEPETEVPHAPTMDSRMVDAALAQDAGVADAPFCSLSIGALCAEANAGCVLDWASAVDPLADGGHDCKMESVKTCGEYNVLSWTGADTGEDDYYDMNTGKLVAIVTGSGNCGCKSCAGGPSAFAPPPCSSSTSLCNLATGSD